MVNLDISSSFIKLLVVKDKTIDKAASLPLETGMVKDGVIENTTAVSELIRQLMSAHNIHDRQIDVCFSGIHSICRIVIIPRVSDNLIDEAIRREMERVIPVPLDEVYMSRQLLAASNTDMTVCVLGIPRNTIDALMTTLRQAGLEARFLMIRPLALAKLVDESNAIVVNVQPAAFDIAVVANGIPVLLRSIVFPDREIPDDQRSAIVAEELDKTVVFYNSSQSIVTLTSDVATFVTGELGAMVSGRIPYRLKQLPKLLNHAADFNAAEYAANIGLVLMKSGGDTGPVRLTMNALPQVYMPKVRLGAIAGWGSMVIAIVLVASLGYFTYGDVNRTSMLESQVQAVRLQVTKIQGTSEEIKKMQAKRDEFKANLDSYKQPLNDARSQRVKMIGDLSSVTRLLPGTINLKSVKCGSQSLTITGTAPEKTIILSYVRALRDTGRFSSVLLSNMSEAEYNKWDFALTLD